MTKSPVKGQPMSPGKYSPSKSQKETGQSQSPEKIDKTTYKNNRVLKKLNEYLKTNQVVSDTLLDYKEQLIEFHYEQVRQNLS